MNCTRCIAALAPALRQEFDTSLWIGMATVSLNVARDDYRRNGVLQVRRAAINSVNSVHSPSKATASGRSKTKIRNGGRWGPGLGVLTISRSDRRRLSTPHSSAQAAADVAARGATHEPMSSPCRANENLSFSAIHNILAEALAAQRFAAALISVAKKYRRQ